MGQVINITDKLVINNQDLRIARLKAEIDIHLKNVETYQIENFRLIARCDQLKQENEELKKHLKTLGTEITYG